MSQPCSTCGLPNPSEAHLCTNCGSVLDPNNAQRPERTVDAAPEAEPPIAAPFKGINSCGSCGFSYSGAFRFCPVCGKELPRDQNPTAAPIAQKSVTDDANTHTTIASDSILERLNSGKLGTIVVYATLAVMAIALWIFLFHGKQDDSADANQNVDDGWTVSVLQDNVRGTTETVIYRPAEGYKMNQYDPSLWIRCGQHVETSVELKYGLLEAGDNNVIYRLDADPSARPEYWEEYPIGTLKPRSDRTSDFMRSLLGANSLWIEVDTLGHNRGQFHFELSGLRSRIQHNCAR